MLVVAEFIKKNLFSIFIFLMAISIVNNTIAESENIKNAWELPTLNLKGLDGKNHTLKEWYGKVILLNFWASWCAPCQYEIRDLTQYQEKLADKGFQVVSLGFDKEQKLRNIHRSLEINYPVLIMEPSNPRTQAIMKQWGNPQNMIPHNVVIDKNGEIKYIHRGQLDEEIFNDYIMPLL